MARPVRNSSALLVRRSGDDDRLFLARRAPQLRFFGNFWAIPGGNTSEADAELTSRVTDEPRRGQEGLGAYVVSAAREGLEEMGVQLIEPGPLSLDLAHSLREDVLKDEEAFGRFLENSERTLPGDRFRPMLNLTTPDFIPIRFKTWFFEVRLSDWNDAPLPEIWPGELVEGDWDTAGGWLARWRKGEILVAPPVLLILDILERHGWDGAPAAFENLMTRFESGTFHRIFFNPAAQLLPLRTPTIPPALHTNAYVVGQDPAYLIDPASPHDDVQEAMDEALEQATKRGVRLSAILLTHHHPDHVGAVEHVRRRWNLPVWAHPVTAQRLSGSIVVDRELHDGERLPLGTAPSGRRDWELVCHFTPGHAPGHLCFHEDEYGSLFAGDMVSTLSSILVDDEDGGDMAEYMRSLRTLAELQVSMVYPSHGPPSPRGDRVLRKQIDHRRQREESIAAAIADGAGAVKEVVNQVYSDVPVSMHRFAAISVQSVVHKLVQDGRVQIVNGRLMPSTEEDR